jgi:hypothetical protein
MTPVGKTDRQSIHNVIAQGVVFGPIFCSKQVDTFGQECLEDNKYTYMYRGEVEIPSLSIVDDLLCVSECGYKTTMANAFINLKTDGKKKMVHKSVRNCMLENLKKILNVNH